jgi:hypothetical protein
LTGTVAVVGGVGDAVVVSVVGVSNRSGGGLRRVNGGGGDNSLSTAVWLLSGPWCAGVASAVTWAFLGWAGGVAADVVCLWKYEYLFLKNKLKNEEYQANGGMPDRFGSQRQMALVSCRWREQQRRRSFGTARHCCCRGDGVKPLFG